MEYKHYIPSHKIVDIPVEYICLDDLEVIREVFRKNEGKYVAYDCETTGLNPEEDKIVGYSVCWGEQNEEGKTKGYYIPIEHKVGKNVGREGLDLLYEHLVKANTVFFYNYRFDIRMLQFAGYDVEAIKYYDVAIGCWYGDTNKKMPSLKFSEEHYLGYKPATFLETLGKNADFSYLDPVEATPYAAQDAIGTYLLAKVTFRYFKAFGLSGKIDNKILYPLLVFENNGIRIDESKLEEIIGWAKPRLLQLEEEIYTAVGQRFTLKSPKQLGEALLGIGISTNKYTATGQMKVDINTLADSHIEHKVIKLLIEYSKLQKLLGSYLEKLLEESKRQHGICRFGYTTTNVPTGRLAGGGDAKNKFFTHMNIQAINKPHPLDYYVHDRAGFTDYRGNEFVVLDWVFTPTDEENPRKSGYIEEGFEQSENIRSAFLADEGGLWVSIDFNAQELRIPSILCKEPTWLVPFQTGEDVHKSTAYRIWGKENYDKSKRKMAKVFNFGLQYGGTAWTIKEKLHIDDLEECEKLLALFKKATSTLHNWQNANVAKAKRDGFVKTYFGFERRVKGYFDDPEKYSFATRTVKNTLVQTTGAYMTKMCILRLWDNLLNPKLKTGCRFLSTIHDEVNLSLPYDDNNREPFIKNLLIFKKCMKLQANDWPIPMDVGISIGSSQGTVFDFIVDDDGKITPKWDPVEEEPEEEEEVTEDIPDFLDNGLM